MALGTTVVLVTASCIPTLWGYILLPRPGSEVEYFSNNWDDVSINDQLKHGCSESGSDQIRKHYIFGLVRSGSGIHFYVKHFRL
jgi:hypothetical protein